MKEILWKVITLACSQPDLRNKFKCPCIQLDLSLIFSMHVKNSKLKMSDCTDFSLWKNPCAFLAMSVFLYSVLISFCYIWEHSHLQSVACHCLGQSDADTLWSVLSVRLLRNFELLSNTTVTQNKLSVGYFNTCNTHLTHSAEHISPWSTLHCQFTVLHADSVIAFLSPPTPCTSLFLLAHFHPYLNGCISCSVPSYVSRTTDGCSNMLSFLHLHG